MLRSALFGALALGAIAAPAAAQVALVETGDTYFVNVRSLADIPYRTVTRQYFDYSCGSASVSTLLTHHYGRPTSEAQAFKAMWEKGDQEKIQKVGFSLLDMKEYFESLGYKADGYRVTIEQLSRWRAPSIAVIQIGAYKHFVVIKGVRDGKVLIGDPAQGLKIYPVAEFEKMWNGIALAIRDYPVEKVAYNREDEWRPWATAPLNGDPANRSLAAFDRSLRPLYQVTQVIDLADDPF